MRITDLPMIDEVKNEYTELRQKGMSRADAVEKMKQNYQNELLLGQDDDGYIFWIGIADAQYAMKELSKEVAEKAMHAIRWLEKFGVVTAGDLLRREKWYSAAPMPERKKVNKPKRFRCEWEIGDTYAYQLSGLMAEGLGLAGKYVLFRKVGNSEFSNGSLYPVVTITLWDRPPFPQNSVEFSKVKPLVVNYGRFDLPKTAFEYRAQLLFRNQKQLAEVGLMYIGNFADAPLPEHEVVFDIAGAITMISPERIDDRCCNCFNINKYVNEDRYRNA